MFKIRVKTKAADRSRAVLDSLAGLTKNQVYVGVPEKKTQRPKGVVTNAQLVFLHTHGVRDTTMRRIVKAKMINRSISFEAATALYIHTHGSPLWQIPPRPIIEPAIEASDNRRAITGHLRVAAKLALEGKRGESQNAMRLAGMEAQNRVRAWFTDPRNNWAPNAPSTVRRKGSASPLIDTGELRKSIIYVMTKEY